MNNLLGSAAIIAVIAAGWQKIKLVAWRIVNLLIVNLRIDADLVEGFLILMEEDFYRSPYGERYFSSVSRYVQPIRKYIPVAYERFNSDDAVLFWQGWSPILVQHPKVSSESVPTQLTISFIRGMWNADKLMTAAMDRYNDKVAQANDSEDTASRFFIHRFVGTGKKLGELSIQTVKYQKGVSNALVWDSGSRFLKWDKNELHMSRPDGGSAVEVLAFPDDILGLVEEAKRWRDSENWYHERSIPWRHGWLLYGSAGNGKTSLVRAIGIDCGLPIMIFDLASMSNSEFIDAWAKMVASYAPCIALFEDIDGVFNGRENIVGENGGGLTFDCFLNGLGGVDDANGVFVVVTTNDPSSIDEALGSPVDDTFQTTRPGRLYRAFELRNPDEECRRKIAARILADWPDEIEDFVQAGEGYSAARFTDMCTDKALTLFWKDNNLKVDITPHIDIVDIENDMRREMERKTSYKYHAPEYSEFRLS